MSIVEDLKAAREIILERGWTKGTFVDHVTGGCCALGAVALAIHREANSYAAIEADPRTMSAIGALVDNLPESELWEDGPLTERLYLFNDARDSSEVRVVALFDTTIRKLSTD